MTDDKVLSVLHQDGCYPVSFLQTLYSFLQAEVLCDVTLQVRDEIIKAHRVVLAASSVYFKAMFGGNLSEKSQEVIAIHDVDPAALKAIIKYAYTSEIQVTESNVQSIMSCASMLQMTSIINACAEFLSSRLHPTNCIGIQQFAALYSCHDLETKATLYTQEHFKEVATLDEFLLLPQNVLVQLISADHLDVESEECVFAAIMRWVKFDKKNRFVFLVELLQHVRFHLLSTSFIQGQADLEPMLADFAVKCASCTTDNFWLNSDTTARYSTTEQVIFALGGESTGYPLTSVQCLLPQANMWQNTLPSFETSGYQESSGYQSSGYQQTVACMGTARTSFGAVAVGKYIYAAGKGNMAKFV
ncbi:kelch-like protein 20 [Amphiura filiformis]|uniref:kelch-like protein 20 n=1 Tax=Amphiura filiformis TaxID=82378 RepID=UPI003B2210CD